MSLFGLFRSKRENVISGVTIYILKLEDIKSTSPFIQMTIKETKSSEKTKTIKSVDHIQNGCIFLRTKDLSNTLKIEIFEKSSLLSSTLLSSGTLQLQDIIQGEKKRFEVDLSPSGKIHIEVEGFNFGKDPKSVISQNVQAKTEPLREESKEVSKYLEVKKIGQGGMGTVYEAIIVSTKERVALKKIFCDNLKQLNNNMNEATFAKGLVHTNLVKYYDVYITNTPQISPYTLCMVMELMTQGDLYSLIKKYKNKKEIFPKDKLLSYMKQITSGIDYLHEKKLVHRDLKPENFLIKDDLIKIADFGLMKDISSEMAKTLAGTLKYMAPEVVSSIKHYDFKADMWSLGCCFLEMMTLKLEKPVYLGLFTNPNFYSDLEKVIEINYEKELSAIVLNLLQKDPQKRISAKDLLKVLNGDMKLDSIRDTNENLFNVELIQKVQFLKSSDKELIQDILNLLQPRVYKKDDVIIKFGEEGNEMYFLNKGVVSALSADKKQVFNVLSEGSFFGEFALLFPIKRTANIVANTECDVFVLSKEDLYKIIEKYPKVGEELKKYGIGSLLKKLAFFKDLEKNVLDEISIHFHPFSYKTTDIIIDKDQEGDYLYIVYNGVASSMNPEIGLFKLYQTGDCFGQECIKNEKYFQKIVALSGMDTFAIKKSNFLNLKDKFEFMKNLFIIEE